MTEEERRSTEPDEDGLDLDGGIGMWGGQEGDELDEAEIADTEQRMLRRQREFRLAAERVAEALAAFPAVEKVVLFGSVAAPLKREVPRFREYRRAGIAVWHECKDVDIALWLRDLTQLSALRKAKAAALRELFRERGIGVADHQVEVFVMEPGGGRYLGRLCEYAACPKGKDKCRFTPGCGTPPFLEQHEGFVLEPDALSPGNTVVLYKRGED